MFQHTIKNNIYYYLLLASVFFFLSPFDKIANLTIILLSIFWLIEGWNPIIKFKKSFSTPLTWIMILYYSLNVFGLINVENINEGSAFLERRMLFVIFPILITGLNDDQINVKKLLLGYLHLLVGISLFSLIVQCFRFPDNWQGMSLFYNDNLISILKKQAVYYAMFINFGLGIIYYYRNHFLSSSKLKYIGIFYILFLITFLFLLASRNSILVTCIITLILVIKNLNKKSLLALVTLIFLVSCSLFFMPKTLNRFKSLSTSESFKYDYKNKNDIYHFNDSSSNGKWNGINTRLALWNCGLEEIEKKPFFGHGEGDVQKVLLSNYEAKGFEMAFNRKLNIHNQFLDYLLSNGIFGFTVFCSVLFFGFYQAFKSNNELLLIFIIIISLACITENIMNRYMGIYFFSLFYSLLCREKTRLD